jgi:hypothetical protein
MVILRANERLRQTSNLRNMAILSLKRTILRASEARTPSQGKFGMRYGKSDAVSTFGGRYI